MEGKEAGRKNMSSKASLLKNPLVRAISRGKTAPSLTELCQFQLLATFEKWGKCADWTLCCVPTNGPAVIYRARCKSRLVHLPDLTCMSNTSTNLPICQTGWVKKDKQY